MEIISAKAKEKEVKVELAALSARVPTAELHEQVRGLEARKQQLIGKLEVLRNGTTKRRMVSVEEQESVEKGWRKWQRTAGARKRICRDLWDKCTEVLPEDAGSKEDLWESLGLEGKL